MYFYFINYRAWLDVSAQQVTMNEYTALLIIIGSLSLILCVISVGSLYTARKIAELGLPQQPRHRSDDELFIGQAARMEVRQKAAELEAAKRENERLKEAMLRLGIDPSTGISRPITGPNTARNRLRQEMINGLSENEVRSVCFHLNIDDEALPDDDKVMLIESLLEEIERSNRQFELFEVLVKMRPERHWISNW